jgi:hypothetical protein
MYGATLYHPAGMTLTEYMNSKGMFRYVCAIIARACGALLIIRQITILKQIIMHRSSALWTAHDTLFYLNIYWDVIYRSVPLSEIVDFKIQSGFAARAGIVMRLRSGQQRVISTWLLSEPADVVMSRLVSFIDREESPPCSQADVIAAL